MKKFLTVAALIWVFFLLQTSVCPWIAFGSIKPNLLVILVASIGFMEGSKAGMWTGFACGLLADLFAATASASFPRTVLPETCSVFTRCCFCMSDIYADRRTGFFIPKISSFR